MKYNGDRRYITLAKRFVDAMLLCEGLWRDDIIRKIDAILSDGEIAKAKDYFYSTED